MGVAPPGEGDAYTQARSIEQLVLRQRSVGAPKHSSDVGVQMDRAASDRGQFL